MHARYQRLYVNIDHVATLRQARRGQEPDPVQAVALCEAAGADGITAHLREDRRHMQDDDIARIRQQVRSYFNLELAVTREMVDIALQVRPEQITLVPERREEITTEGGLDVERNASEIERVLGEFKQAGIRTSLFIAPTINDVDWSHNVGADAIELHTGHYANVPHDPASIEALRTAAHHGAQLGLAIHAGHGLTVDNLAPVAAIPEIEELNIGHSIISRSIFIGLDAAVREIRHAMNIARAT